MKDWKLGGEDWTRLLKWLNPDPELAAQVYEAIRQKLISYFLRRGCSDVESLADRTIDRVTRKLRSFNGAPPDNPLRYCYGVARYIHKEYCHEQADTGGGTVTDAQPDPYQPASAEAQEVLERCLGNCLQKLDAEKRDTFIRYYLAEPKAGSQIHQWLAEQMGITINALRLRVLRVKEELRICITACQRR